MNLDFSNKHTLITGGAMGIGKEIARQFGASNSMVTIFDHNKKALSETVDEFEESGISVNAFLCGCFR